MYSYLIAISRLTNRLIAAALCNIENNLWRYRICFIRQRLLTELNNGRWNSYRNVKVCKWSPRTYFSCKLLLILKRKNRKQPYTAHEPLTCAVCTTVKHSPVSCFQWLYSSGNAPRVVMATDLKESIGFVAHKQMNATGIFLRYNKQVRCGDCFFSNQIAALLHSYHGLHTGPSSFASPTTIPLSFLLEIVKSIGWSDKDSVSMESSIATMLALFSMHTLSLVIAHNVAVEDVAGLPTSEAAAAAASCT